MKKMMLACAIVVLSFNVASCTKEPVAEEDTEQLTTGENEDDEVKPG